jgi:uncharacterized protein DUF1549/uncharacterized protein DUF1553/cytochrome c
LRTAATGSWQRPFFSGVCLSLSLGLAVFATTGIVAAPSGPKKPAARKPPPAGALKTPPAALRELAPPSPPAPPAPPARSPAPAQVPAVPAPSAEAVEFFERKVRPVLVESCYACHSASTPKPMGGLRLDSRAALLKGGVRGPAVVPGDPEKSPLIQAVEYHDPRLQMPPKGRLPEEKVAALVQWVKMDAPWPSAGGQGSGVRGRGKATASTVPHPPSPVPQRHWSFQPLKRPPLPAVKAKGQVQSPVDRIILAKLEAAKIPPAPPADRRTLIRRVTYDLTGLPPTPAEVEAFVNDRSPDAWAKVVDRLLASPHFGERWARHWLDLVRFAETDGHEYDFDKPGAWQYRDYVIRALNADVPYDQFVMEHVAGDLLPQPRRDPADGTNQSVVGTGFWWLGEGKHSPVDLREDEAERIDNQIDVLSRGFLGLTVSCARCHDHKFDPISTKDYYALSGFLKSSRYHLAAINSPERAASAIQELEALQTKLRPLLLERAGHLSSARIAALEANPQAASAKALEEPLYPWIALAGVEPQRFTEERKALAKRLRDLVQQRHQEASARIVFEDFDRGSYAGWFASGEAFGSAPGPEKWTVSADGGRIESLVGRGVADSGRLSGRLQGVLRSKTFTIEKRKIFYRLAGQNAKVNLIIQGFQRIRDPLYGRLTLAVQNPSPAWHVQDVSKWNGHRAYIEIVDPGSGWIAADQVLFGDGGPPAPAPNPLVTRIVEDPTVFSPGVLAQRYLTLLRESVRLWTAGQLDGALAQARLDLVDWLLRSNLTPPPSSVCEPAGGVAVIAALQEQRGRAEASIPEAVRVMAMADGSPEEDRVHIRGSVRNLGEVAPRGFLAVLAGGKQPPLADGSGRLDLAKRMSAHPLLARVIVNRVWGHLFGEGIVRTPDDFGARGERPTHPELLDWLAGYFVAGNGEMGKRGNGKPAQGNEAMRKWGNGGDPKRAAISSLPHFPISSPKPWSLKNLIRLLVMSTTYQRSSQSAIRNPQSAIGSSQSRDPQNRLLHHMPMRRLEAEAVRDAILAVSGRLDRRMFGPGVLPHLTPFMEGRGRPGQSGPLDGDGRRSVYINVRRNFLTPMFLAFDYPVPFTTMGKRSISTVPAQALTLMNNPFVIGQAEVWAKRVLAEPDLAPKDRIVRMYETAFARPPSTDELSAALAFLEEQDRRYGAASDPRSWADLCHVLFNTKELIFIN